MLKPMFGKFIAGVCKGISTRQITNRTTGEISQIVELGISSYRQDNFGDMAETVEMVQLSKSLVSQGAPSKLANLKGQHIMVPVWYNAYASKNGAAMNTYLANDWESQLFTFKPEMAKAV
jgi:hypothetical protein